MNARNQTQTQSRAWGERPAPRGFALFTASVLLCAAQATAQAQASAGSLLDGLKAPAAEPEPDNLQTPAEAKINDGAPKLRWSMESGGRKKTTRRFHEEQGYLVMKSGEQLNGFITFRAEKEAAEPWKISQVEFREAKDGQKRKITPAEVQDFSFAFTMADYKRSDDPARNFEKGFLKLEDGKEMQGYVALAKIWAAGSVGGAGSRAVYFARNETANIEEFRPAKVQEMVQTRSDGQCRWINYSGALVPVLVNGKNLLLFRNPRPTTRATGLLASLRSFGGEVAEGVATQAAANRAAHVEAERRFNAGQNVGSIAVGAAAKGQEAADLTSTAFSEMDFRGFKTEYVIRNTKTGFEAIVTDENIADNVGPLLNACRATAKLDRKQRKEQLRFSNIQSLSAPTVSLFEPVSFLVVIRSTGQDLRLYQRLSGELHRAENQVRHTVSTPACTSAEAMRLPLLRNAEP